MKRVVVTAEGQGRLESRRMATRLESSPFSQLRYLRTRARARGVRMVIRSPDTRCEPPPENANVKNATEKNNSWFKNFGRKVSNYYLLNPALHLYPLPRHHGGGWMSYK